MLSTLASTFAVIPEIRPNTPFDSQTRTHIRISHCLIPQLENFRNPLCKILVLLLLILEFE